MYLGEKETEAIGSKEVTSQDETVLSLSEGWMFRQTGSDKWYPGTVPGSNFTDLLKNDLISDPFWGTNEDDLQWIESESWEYKVTFQLTRAQLQHQRVDLTFEGLDTYAEVLLNGQKLLEADNMFVEWRAEVSGLLREGENSLSITFQSPTEYIKKFGQIPDYRYPAENDHSEENLSVFVRKAPYHFGWDWGPRFVTSGIWRPVKLTFRPSMFFEDVHFQYEIDDDQVRVKALVEFQSQLTNKALISVNCLNEALDVISHPVEASAGRNRVQFSFSIKDVKKWWPKALGDPFLYLFRVDVSVDGSSISAITKKIGFRTIEVVQEDDEYGQSFFFQVNGFPLFIKGANYIPQDSFLDRVSPQSYKRLFDDAFAANINMLRVWGGGIYENDEFYDLADERGMLVWQDFMFACTLYPGDQSFLENVGKEAVYNVKRLRHHASIALWCGNNEIHMGWNHWDWQKKFRYSDELQKKLHQDYLELFEGVLPEIVARYDGSRFYLPSSPISNWEEDQDFTIGDNHYWGVWHGEAPFSEFKNKVPRFMSEYGFQSFPLGQSVEKYAPKSEWALDSEVMKLHQKHPRGNDLITQYMASDYHVPEDFESFLYVSQILQAEGMRVGMEAHRRHKPYCMGTLYWQFNDCWPVASWSGIDYYGQWKALHYMVKRQYADVLVTCDIGEQNLELYVVSDLMSDLQGEWRLELFDLQGNKLLDRSDMLLVEKNKSQKCFEAPIKELLGDSFEADVILKATVTSTEAPLSQNTYHFVPVKDLNLKAPTITYDLTIEQEVISVKLKTDTLAKGVFLSFEKLEGNFSDNFFDLIPGETKVVSFPLSAEYKQSLPKLKIMSLKDTY